MKSLKALDFADFGICVDCIKSKQTNKTKKDVKRSSHVLEIVHIDIFALLKCVWTIRNISSPLLITICDICTYICFIIRVKH